MHRRDGPGWPAALAPLLLCLPCLLALLLALGGAALLSAVGGFVTENRWVTGAVLLLGTVPAAVLFLAYRRHWTGRIEGCCSPGAESPHARQNTTMEARR